ncbi:MAG: AbrB/MazE/SpoVT family DNA-binding domain-containing protein [Candidatus Hydrogenedentes bacterium]|nr:AbrB/MazE/SpoVT family DNA-binding domain-containing protein [Candidatus Hydrogenedentota bacterium]
MAKKQCCSPVTLPDGGFQVEAVLSVDERGQMILPKEFRTKAGIQPGDKLALVSFERDGTLCCACLIKTENFAGMIKSMLGPMVDEIAR